MGDNLDDLLSLIKEEETKIKRDTSKHASTNNASVHQFIEAYGISEGTTRITTTLLYQKYRAWCKEKWKQPCGNTEFFRTFKKYSPQYRHGKQRFYMITAGSLQNLMEEKRNDKKEEKEIPPVE